MKIMTKSHGFTLIEILIALAVFAILATITSSVMFYAFNTRARVAEHAERLVTLQLAISLLERDTEQTVVRAVRGNEMRLFSAFVGQKNYMELTRGGFANPGSEEKRSMLKRVGYLCDGSQLLRRSWGSLDSVDRKNSADKILLNNLTKCQFNYLNQNSQLLPEWRENAVTQNQKSEPLPKAVQLSLVFKDWGELSLLFQIPKAMYANSN
jgi:general secretion pathway protein J